MNYEKFLYEEFPSLIERLEANQQPAWGSMTAQRMVEHLQQLFSISNGKLEAPATAEPERMAYRKSRFFEKYIPFPVNFMAPKVVAPNEAHIYPNIEVAKEALMRDFRRFHDYMTEHSHLSPMHPYFGPLNHDEWVQFHARHVRHHLIQFGLAQEIEA